MRWDMQKVIIDRPRVGGKSYQKPPKPQIKENDYFDGPVKESMTKDKKRQWANKRQTDVLGPLKRFLRKRVGNKWDDVWSEISQESTGVMGSHLKDHVEWLVERNVWYGDDGKVYDTRGYEINNWRDTLYVDPNGVLRELKRKPQKKRVKEPKIFNIKGQDYYKHDGIWYRVTMKEAGELPRYGYIYDVFGNGGHEWGYSSVKWKLVEAYGKNIYCTKKEQANSKECKKLNAMAS